MPRSGYYLVHHTIRPAVILGCAPRGRLGLLRLSALILVMIVAVAVFFAASIGGEPVHRLQTPALRAAPIIAQATQPETEKIEEVEAEEYPNIRIGSFEKDRKSTRLNSSHANISYAVFCLKKKTSVHLVSDT